MFELKGHVAFVTGAGRNTGAAIASALAGQGAAVVVNDISTERADTVARQINNSGGSAVPAPCDVTDLDELRSVVTRASGQLGTIDILVINTGVPQTGFTLAPFLETSPDEWRRYVDLNLYGVMNGVHVTLGDMVEQGWGRIVAITSDAGRTGEANMAPYSAAKAGVAGFCRALAKEVGRHGVTVNCVSLATISVIGGRPNPSSPEHYPVGRLGEPEDVTPAVIWLASNEASWVTGQTVPVNGGYLIT